MRERLRLHLLMLSHLRENSQYLTLDILQKQLKELMIKISPTFMLDKIFDGHSYIYVLKLDNDKYYIGQTNHFLDRMIDHFNNRGSVWTKTYKPLELIELVKTDDKTMENKMTKKYMRMYGIDNVRGGSYCKTILTKNPLEDEEE
jgi:predicted GIY-YIG superfamily endonuclease